MYKKKTSIGVFILAFLFAILSSTSQARDPPPPPSWSQVACATCILAIQELEGLGSEPLSEQSVKKYLETDVCPKLGSLGQYVCDLLANNVWVILKFVDDELQPAKTCLQLDLCPVLEKRGPDDVPLPVFQVDLDQPPAQRWQHVVNATKYWTNLYRVYDTFKAVLHTDVSDAVIDFGNQLFKLFPDPFGSEISGIATSTGLPVGFVAILNLFYELTNSCTSIVAQHGANGPIMFARNQDLGYGMGFTDLLRNDTIHVQFTQSGKVVHEAVTFAGYVGTPTAYVPGKWALAANSRNFNGTFWQYLQSVYQELQKEDAHVATWLVREAMMQNTDFAQAKQMLSTKTIVTNIYYIIGGTQPGEGAVIARKQDGPRYIETLDYSKGTWYLLQTNYDKNTSAPFFDDRRYYANLAIKKDCGAPAGSGSNVTESCLFETLSTRPVLNLLTLYTAQVIPVSKAPLIAHSRICHEENNVPCAL